jgi:hypothetical protein
MNRHRFEKGSVVIPTGHHFPEGALAVDGYDEVGNLLAHPVGGGLQYAIRPEQAAKLRLVTDAEGQANLHRYAHFALEGVEGVFAGWTDGRHWNGWATPHFERGEADRVAAAFDARFDPERDAYITMSQDGEEDAWAAVDIQISDGSGIKAYGIGAGAWIWDEVEPEQRG